MTTPSENKHKAAQRTDNKLIYQRQWRAGIRINFPRVNKKKQKQNSVADHQRLSVAAAVMDVTTLSGDVPQRQTSRWGHTANYPGLKHLHVQNNKAKATPEHCYQPRLLRQSITAFRLLEKLGKSSWRPSAAVARVLYCSNQARGEKCVKNTGAMFCLNKQTWGNTLYISPNVFSQSGKTVSVCIILFYFKRSTMGFPMRYTGVHPSDLATPSFTKCSEISANIPI